MVAGGHIGLTSGSQQPWVLGDEAEQDAVDEAQQGLLQVGGGAPAMVEGGVGGVGDQAGAEGFDGVVDADAQRPGARAPVSTAWVRHRSSQHDTGPSSASVGSKRLWWHSR